MIFLPFQGTFLFILGVIARDGSLGRGFWVPLVGVAGSCLGSPFMTGMAFMGLSATGCSIIAAA